jgi:uncharacterized protein YndB with AHSA1/START domain
MWTLAGTEGRSSMQKMSIERTFNAPIAQVWRAFTTVELLEKWWAPAGMSAGHVSLDLKPEGLFLYCFESDEGVEYWGRGIFTKIEEPTRLEYMDTFADAKGNPVPPSAQGMPGDEVVESLVALTFRADGDQTTMLMSNDFFWDEALVENVKAGWTGMFNKLDFVLLEMEE